MKFKRRVSTHQAGKLYKCRRCDKEFYTKEDLNKHVWKDHKENY